MYCIFRHYILDCALYFVFCIQCCIVDPFALCTVILCHIAFVVWVFHSILCIYLLYGLHLLTLVWYCTVILFNVLHCSARPIIALALCNITSQQGHTHSASWEPSLLSTGNQLALLLSQIYAVAQCWCPSPSASNKNLSIVGVGVGMESVSVMLFVKYCVLECLAFKYC